jgi:hypothetical protein
MIYKGNWEQTNFGAYKPECGCYIPRHIAEKKFDSLKMINPRCWLPSCSGEPNIYKNSEARKECKASICQNNVDFSGVNAGGDIAAKINTNCPGAIKPKPPPPAPINCVGGFQVCGANCKKKYLQTTIAQHGGKACPHENGYEEDCLPGQGNCPKPVEKKDCQGSFSACDTNCKKTWNITTPAQGGGTCPNAQGKQLPCKPGEGQCPQPPAPADQPAPAPADQPAPAPADQPAPATAGQPAAAQPAAQPASQPASQPAPAPSSDDSDSSSNNMMIMGLVGFFLLLILCYCIYSMYG